MNRIAICFWVLLSMLQAAAQNTVEQLLENATTEDELATEDDAWLQQLEDYRKHALDVNAADQNDLKQLQLLTDWQIEQLIAYKRILGPLNSIYELQAVPGFDVETIRKLLPYVTVGELQTGREELFKRFKQGSHQLLLRISRHLEKSTGYGVDNGSKTYDGGPQHILFRYRYNYKNLLQYGLLGEKDAGESFLSRTQGTGFDFYSIHFAIRNIGIFRTIVIGDYTVNFGQGLIHWQSLAFKKSSGIMSVKRQSPVIRPYQSPGEFTFHRGVGVCIGKGKLEASFFASLRKLSAAIDSSETPHIASFMSSGYHRTVREIITKANVSQFAVGTRLSRRFLHGNTGINWVGYLFSLPIQKKNEPYNLFAVSGTSWFNASFDYDYTYKNLHYFGELAFDKKKQPAFLHGLLASIAPTVDFSIVHRMIGKGYQAIYGNAFTENILPNGESGIYAGISVRLSPAWKLDAYADMYQFTWLKFNTDAPANGYEYLVQLSYIPTRRIELFTRFRYEGKPHNEPGLVSNAVVQSSRQNWRTHLSYQLDRQLLIRSRIEILWYDKRKTDQQAGLLLLTDINYKPMLKPYTILIRFQYFETDSYLSRLYAYENDVLYSYSLPAIFDSGYRYYLVFSIELGKKLSLWAKWSQTIKAGVTSIGSGDDQIAGNRRSEIKFQCLYSLSR